MKPKLSPVKKPPSAHKDPNSDTTDLRNPRNGLLPYIQAPEKAIQGGVVSDNDKFVLIKDAFPKATVHLLLLPRDLKHANMHPYDALQDAKFLAATKLEVEKAKNIVASELRRLHGSHSAMERPRLEALESDDFDEGELPTGRDWLQDVVAGIHTHPSMNHMHIHILSRDMYSERLKHRKHYNSFNTEFFVPLDDFPMSEAEIKRRRSLRWHEMDMLCWRCGKNFGNKFTRLKEHLEEEFLVWRKE